MDEHAFTVLYKLRFLLGAALIVFCLLLLSIILSVTSGNYMVQAQTNNPSANNLSTGLDNNPNIIAQGMDTGLSKYQQISGTANKTLNNSLHGAASSIGSAATNGSKTIGHGIYSGAVFTAHGMTKSFAFMVRAPGNIIGRVSHIGSVSSIIKPADADQSTVPTIKASTSAVSTQGKPAPTAKTTNQAVAPSSAITIWPIHGIITTEFGVPEWPYQPIHTGLDISDGKFSGITAIKPFKPGRVSQVIRSSSGLGNHVIIDHGGGMTSVYGHLYSISVAVGQNVDQGATVGYEGSTGASTGTHLHFEIRINGQPVNPHLYVSGHP